MFGRKRRIIEAITAVRSGYDRAITDAGVVLFQQVGPDADGHFVSPSMAEVLGWDAAAFRDPGTLRRLVHPDDLAVFRSVAPDGADRAISTDLPDATGLRCGSAAGADAFDDIDSAGSLESVAGAAGVPGTGICGASPYPTDDEPVVRFLTATGGYRPMLVRMVRTGLDEPIRGTLIDVAPGEEPRRQARRFAEVAAASHHGHLLFELLDRDDPDSIVFRSANASARSLFELDAAVLDGGHLGSVFDGPSARLLQSAMYDVAHTGESLTAERLSFAEVPGTFIDLRIDRLKDGSLGVTIDDVTRSVEVEERLRHQASHDHLTGLPNRSAFDDRLSLVAAGLAPGEHVAVVLVDIDGLDDVNRQSGRHSGDYILGELGRRLAEEVSGIDVVARIGGDEFAVLTTTHADRDAALDRARLIREALDQPLDIGGELCHVRCTIGASVAPEHGVDPGTLVRSADGALRHARSAADAVAVFVTIEERTAMRRVGLLTELRRGLANQELELRYQPIVDLRTGRVAKVEALLRWQRAGSGPQRSVELLEMAEKSGLIEPLTRWILGESARAAERIGRDREPIVVSTNLSMRNLRNDDLLTFIGLLAGTGELPCNLIEVELPEGELTADSARAEYVVGALRALGLGVVVDDFGTGYMSIEEMSALAVTGIKIDRGYTTAIASVPAEAEAVGWAIGVAHDLGVPVTADGVADADSLSMLAEMGCDLAQGLHLSEPVTFEALPSRVEALEAAMLGWVGTTSAVLVD